MAQSSHMPRRVVLDANLLLVAVIGRDHADKLGSLKHVKEYMPADYPLLRQMVSQYDQIVLTPNVMTECSDLLKDSAVEQDAKSCLRELAIWSGAKKSRLVVEDYVPSAIAATMNQYSYLGIADCALLSLVDQSTALVTVDHKLAAAAAERNPASVNFNYLRNYL